MHLRIVRALSLSGLTVALVLGQGVVGRAGPPAPAPAPAPADPGVIVGATDKWSPGRLDGSVLPRGLLVERAQAAARAAQAPGGKHLMSAAEADLQPCEEDPAFLCGTVPVPLDRRQPDGRVVDIHVEVFPHTGADPVSDGAVLATCGGPGCSATLYLKYGLAFVLLADLAETRDLVFVDQRGVGLSDVIDCPRIQAGGLADFYSGARECHDQLGDAADLYSTTDVADDLDDVRAALGYQQVDLFGASYAGADMLTYAVRHPSSVRSSVLSSPAVVVGTDPFYRYAPDAMPGVVADVCGRSPACAAAQRDPARAFARLAAQLRRHPVVGDGVDSEGLVHRMKVTENLLSNAITYFNGAHFTGPGEIAQAAEALRRGDEVPLLRLAADVDPAAGFGSDLREFSNGHLVARSCVDAVLPFDKGAAPRDRAMQYGAAYAAEPDRYGVISKQAWAAPGWLGFQPAPCITSEWEDRPMYPEGTEVTGVPTLVLGGEYDLPVPESVARLATDVMAGATYVSMSAAGHDPHFWSDCGSELVQRFYRDLDVGDTSCADEPAGGWWVPGSFPTRVRQAPPATQVGGPPASRMTRRLATVVAWTVMDSVNHNRFVPQDSVGLRGGRVEWEPLDNASRRTLHDVRFTEDVTVSGPSVTLVTDVGGQLTGDFTITEPRQRVSQASVSGLFQGFGEHLTVVLHSRDRSMSFTVPAY